MMTKEVKAIPAMKTIFEDSSKQAFFEREGYIVFRLLEQEEVADLKNFYQSLNIQKENSSGYLVSMDDDDKNMSSHVREKILHVALPRLQEHLHAFKNLGATFVVKEPNPKGVVPAHQDWSFVDKEDEGYCSIICWTALVETTVENGALGLIRGSHRMIQNNRPSPSPHVPLPIDDSSFSIFPYTKTIEMKPGEVLMFDNRIIHASPPNMSESIRLAVGVGITQKDAKFWQFFMFPI